MKSGEIVHTSSGGGGGMDSNKEKKTPEEVTTQTSALNHVGEIDENTGGVDPEIDKTLVRLAEGP
jgi:hypothetical protein